MLARCVDRNCTSGYFPAQRWWGGLPLSVFYPRKIRAQVKLYSSSSSSSFEIARSASPSHPPLSPFRSLSSPSTTAASDLHFPALPPARSPLSFIQFNFEPRTGRQAERGAPWLPGTGPSHYTANWFWPAAMSAACLPHTPHHLCTSDRLQQRRYQNTREGKRQAAPLTCIKLGSRARNAAHIWSTDNKFSLR